jgi:hypothetical protein
MHWQTLVSLRSVKDGKLRTESGSWGTSTISRSRAVFERCRSRVDRRNFHRSRLCSNEWYDRDSLRLGQFLGHHAEELEIG